MRFRYEANGFVVARATEERLVFEWYDEEGNVAHSVEIQADAKPKASAVESAE